MLGTHTAQAIGPWGALRLDQLHARIGTERQRKKDDDAPDTARRNKPGRGTKRGPHSQQQSQTERERGYARKRQPEPPAETRSMPYGDGDLGDTGCNRPASDIVEQVLR